MEKNSRKRCEFLSPISLKILILHVLFPNTVEINFFDFANLFNNTARGGEFIFFRDSEV